MATLTIRNLSDEVRRALKLRAARNNRSMEAEVRAILELSVDNAPRFIDEWLKSADLLRGPEVELPQRSKPREVDLA